MKSNKWNIVLAILCMLASACFVVRIVKPNEAMSREIASVIAICYLVSSVLYFCIYARNKNI